MGGIDSFIFEASHDYRSDCEDCEDAVDTFWMSIKYTKSMIEVKLYIPLFIEEWTLIPA